MSARPVYAPLAATDLRNAPRIALYGLWAGPFPLCRFSFWSRCCDARENEFRQAHHSLMMSPSGS